MRAGRKLDALIAERVFGFKVPKDDSLRRHIPRYSTSLADARDIIDHLRLHHPMELGVFGSVGFDGEKWKVGLTIETPEKWVGADAKTLPLAICLAALAAISPAPPSEKPSVNPSHPCGEDV